MAAMQQQVDSSGAMAAAVLMGSGTSQGNLANVRARARELRNSLAQVHDALSHSAQQLTWDAVLDKYATLNMQTTMLRDQLRGVLRQMHAHPCMVDDPGVALALPIQLASRLTPQLEAEQAEIVAAAHARLAAQDLPMDARYEEVEKQVDDFNMLVMGLTGADRPLGPQGPHRKAMRQMSGQIASSLDERRAAEARLAAARAAGTQELAPGAAAAIAERAGPAGQRAGAGAGGGGAQRAPLHLVLQMLLPGENVIR